MLLSDGFIANGSEPWQLPDVSKFARIEVRHPGPLAEGATFHPYERDERLARPWAVPGTPGLMHRIGGLEKQDVTGNVCYDAENHQHMVNLRARKVANVALDVPLQAVDGPEDGDLLVVSWGGTYGACATAVHHAQLRGQRVAHCHLRYLNPWPRNLGEILQSYRQILVPELNRGQLRMLLRAEFLVNAQGLNKIKGKPFVVHEIETKLNEMLRA
jgi:2-oxoglutarate ferredoxin oxidoreductase subunit alpha